MIAKKARFFDAGSHGGGPEISHEDECEKFGPIFRLLAAKTCYASLFPLLGLLEQHRSQKNGAIDEWFSVWWGPMHRLAYFFRSDPARRLGDQLLPAGAPVFLYCARLESHQTLDEIGRHHRRLQGFRERRGTIALKIAQIITLLNQKVGERPIVLDHLHPLVQQS